jgi:hypothetical protein
MPFFESPWLSVTGRVDEYEPESVWVRVEGCRGGSELLRRIVEGAELQAFRLQQSLEQRREVEPGDAP